MKKIGFWTALSLVVGNIIGVGIFTTTGYIAARVNNPVTILWIWAAGALYAVSGAIVYGFLAKQMPYRGGDYYYLKEHLPPYFSFLFAWSGLFITYTGSIATLAIGAATYLNDFLTVFSFEFLGINEIKIYAILFVLIFTFINVLGIKSGGKTQLTLTGIIVLLLIGFIIFGYRQGATTLITEQVTQQSSQLSLLFAAFAAVFFTYMGWTTVVYIADEVKNPKRNIPLVLILGIAIIVVLYMGINFIFLSTIPVFQLANQVNAASLVAEQLWGSAGVQVISGVILIAILSSLNSTILSGPRIYQALAADGYLWPSLRSQHQRFDTPANALWVQGIWTILLLVSGTFEQLLSMVVAIILVFSLLTSVVAFKILFKTNLKYGKLFIGVTVFYALLCLLILLNILFSQFWTTMAGMAILSPSFFVWLWQRKTNK